MSSCSTQSNCRLCKRDYDPHCPECDPGQCAECYFKAYKLYPGCKPGGKRILTNEEKYGGEAGQLFLEGFLKRNPQSK